MKQADAGMVIRPIDTIDEYHDCEQLQRDAWGFDTDLDVIPLTQLVAARKADGIVLGAFDAAQHLLGFTYGFLGRDADGTWLVYSHMTAVQPRLRSSGLGRALKWAQREAALQRGLRLMVWTYDPLESLNGYFNFSKLGVVAGHYWPNLYGETSSKLHRGTATDRLRADWHLDSQRVERRRRGLAGALASAVATAPERHRCVLRADDRGAPSEPELRAEEGLLIVEVPGDVQGLKGIAPAMAMAWRDATRRLFTHYLEAGYFVRECVRTTEPAARTFYVLQRGAPGPLED